MNKLIKLSNTHYIVVDDSEIKTGDWFISLPRQTFHKCTSKFGNNLIDDSWQGREVVEICIADCKKITHSTEPKSLGVGWSQSVLPLLLTDVEEAIYGYNVEKIAHSIFDADKKASARPTHFEIRREVDTQNIIRGFKAHQQLTKDKLFTVEDMRKMYDLSCGQWDLSELPDQTENNERFNKLLQSLLPKTEWDITFDEQGKIKLL